MKLARCVAFGFTCLISSTIYPQEGDSEGFKNRDFLLLEDEQVKYWLTGAIEALYHVAAAKSEEKGQCVFDWYYTDTPQKNGIILGSIEKYPNSTPSAVLLALTELECGTYRK